MDDVYDENFKEMFLPTYSSELNPIERLWSFVKRKWVRDLQTYVEELQKIKNERGIEELRVQTIEKIRLTVGKFI